MSTSIYHRKVELFIPYEFDDPNNKGKKSKGFYIRASIDTGSKVQDLIYRAAALAEGRSSDINLFIFAQRVYNRQGELIQDDAAAWEEMWADGKGELAKEGIDAKELLIPSDRPYMRFWTKDVGSHKKGEPITDKNGTPIIYTQIPVIILCTKTGDNLQDPDKAARRWIARNEKDGFIKFVTENENVKTDTSNAFVLTEEMKVEMEIALEEASAVAGLDKEMMRANFEKNWIEKAKAKAAAGN